MLGEKRLIEFKARCADLGRVRKQLKGKARLLDVLRQRDTYFRSPRGRLKIRETEGVGGAQLIFYQRSDEPEVRQSSVFLCRIDDAASVKQILSEVLGVEGSVEKVREVFSWDGVKVHLDEVKSLGGFIEMEMELDEEVDVAAGKERVEGLMSRLGLKKKEIVPSSYIDLLTSRR